MQEKEGGVAVHPVVTAISRGHLRGDGHGTWSLLGDDGTVLSTGQFERPQDGHVADNGHFIFSDRLLGDGLNGRLVGF